jgi:hypothetical protein
MKVLEAIVALVGLGIGGLGWRYATAIEQDVEKLRAALPRWAFSAIANTVAVVVIFLPAIVSYGLVKLVFGD